MQVIIFPEVLQKKRKRKNGTPENGNASDYISGGSAEKTETEEWAICI